MYAVIRTGGKQYRVKQGDLLKVEKLEQPVGATVALEVLAVGEGEGIQIGTPTVETPVVTKDLCAACHEGPISGKIYMHHIDPSGNSTTNWRRSRG